MNNQDWVIKEFRRVADASFPAPYTRQPDGSVWMSVRGQENPYRITTSDHQLTGVFSVFYPDWNLLKFISPQQHRKILSAYETR